MVERLVDDINARDTDPRGANTTLTGYHRQDRPDLDVAERPKLRPNDWDEGLNDRHTFLDGAGTL
jgi:hypothetical protein